MSKASDVEAFERRARSYDTGRLGEWHSQLVRRVVDIIHRLEVTPTAVLDVGCGTGQLLTLLAESLPTTTELVGVDLAAGMVEAAIAASRPPGRVRVEQAAAESLPFADRTFDLVVSTVSFDHWADQQAGLRECARVLSPRGLLLVADLIAPWLTITTIGRRERARTPRQLTTLLHNTGLRPVAWRRVMSLGPLPLIQAVVAEQA